MAETELAVLLAIEQHQSEHPWAPSYGELGDRAGIRSRGHVLQVLRALEHRGFVRLGPAHTPRSLELLRPSSEFPLPHPARRPASRRELEQLLREVMDEMREFDFGPSDRTLLRRIEAAL